jgi:hypothetical protein
LHGLRGYADFLPRNEQTIARPLVCGLYPLASRRLGEKKRPTLRKVSLGKR